MEASMRGNINRIVENIKTGIKTYGFITNDEGTDYFFHRIDSSFFLALQ